MPEKQSTKKLLKELQDNIPLCGKANDFDTEFKCRDTVENLLSQTSDYNEEQETQNIEAGIILFSNLLQEKTTHSVFKLESIKMLKTKAKALQDVDNYHVKDRLNKNIQLLDPNS